MSAGGFCTECGHRIESFTGLNACPLCGTQSVPCCDVDQVTISINWQELRLLVIWAENYQRAQTLGRTVYAIASRIEQQHPDQATRLPLSFAGELGQVAAKYDIQVTDPALRRDIAEQTGEEVGLVRIPPPIAEAGS